MVYLRNVAKDKKDVEKFRVLINLAPEVGFEPTTKRLTAARSTTELLGNLLPVCAQFRSGRSQSWTD